MNDAEVEVDDLRIRAIRPLVPSACLIEDVPADAAVYETVGAARTAVELAIRGEDDRLVVIVGPASIHDRAAVLEFAQRLHEAATKLSRELIVVLRAFMDKPAGSAWSGMINDPDLDGSFQINKGFKQARQLLVEVVRLGLPVACEYLDTISPQFVADLISLNTTDSRTSESRLHRELASGLSTPVGFRNASSGDTRVAVEAVRESARPHAFLSVSKQGLAGIVETGGNRDCHVVLHGGSASEETVGAVCAALEAEELPARVMVDCGSGNVPATQAAVAEAVAGRIAGGDTHVFGVALHSFLVSGRQELTGGQAPIYGMSVTEPCLDWSATAEIIGKLAAAVQQRRDLAASAMPPAAKRGRH
jgi:3-deoxy-7-phosphoheptulonate synthase